jgi:hypothetical protein
MHESTPVWGVRRPIVVYFALLVFLGAIVLQSVRMGAAGLIVEVAQGEADRWAASTRPPSTGEFNRVADYFSDSLNYFPGNPWALEGVGRLDLARMRTSKVPDQALALAQDARKQFREALRGRPTSPFLWANLALSKLYLDEIDEEFLAALWHADELGPWEPGSQQVVLFAGLAAWDKLDRGQRQALSRVVERGGRRNAMKMFEIVKGYRRFDLVCGLKGYDGVAGPDCRKASEPANTGVPKARGKH